MFEQAAVVQMEVKLDIWLLLRLQPTQRKQSGLTVREEELFGVEQRLVAPVRGYGPLQRLVSLETFVVHAGKHRSQRSDLRHDFRRMFIAPICTKMIGNILDDLPIGPASFQRLKHFVEPLDSAFGAGKGAFLFQTW